MIHDRRMYQLSKDQPILREARRRRGRGMRDRDSLEADFWKSFNLEKLGRYSSDAPPLRRAS